MALFALPVTALMLRAFGYRRLHGWMARANGRPSGDPDQRAGELAWAVAAAARHGLGRPMCLARSMALRWMLRRAGIDSELRIGVRKSPAGPGIEAHAWIERNGLALNDTHTVRQRYAVFERTAADVPVAAWD